MITIRERKIVATRQIRPLIDIAVTHELLDELPLHGENWAERWCTAVKDMESIYEDLFNFEVRDDDVFLLGFMKSGNTWMNEALWQLMKGLDLNYSSIKENEFCRYFFEYSSMYRSDEDRISMYNKIPGPRLLQTHFPVNLLPKQYWQKKPKTVYVARNVKDVVISSYHFTKGLGIWCGTIDEFVQDFINHNILYTPYWAHIVDFWKLRHEPYIIFITYEEMKRDLDGVIKKMCVFLEKPALSELEMNLLLEHLSFERMGDNKKANPTARIKAKAYTDVDTNFQFMRRGIVGSYKDELSVENQKLLNEWSCRILAKHGIREEDIFGNI